MTVTSVTAVAVSFRATSVSGSSGASSGPEPSAAPSPRAAAASRRADTLVSRLDTDDDGAISKDEFTSGAIDLLKRASVRAHHRHVGQGDGIDKRDARWQARLERAFDRIDANGDGSVDHGELAARMMPKERPGHRKGQEGASSDAAPAPTTSVTSVTLVAIAIRRYTVDAAAAPAAPATGATPATGAAPAAQEPPATQTTQPTQATEELQPAA
jgi:hypothetical protein